MTTGVVQRRWASIAGRQVSLSVVELGLACCGIEVRVARRAADLLGEAIASGRGGPEGGGQLGAYLPSEAADGLDGEDRHAVRDLDDGGQGRPADLNVLVVAGTVTARLAPTLVAAYHQLPEPRAVLAFGACAATGGPYWDSYSVLPGAHTVVPVDVWVAGCPPRPADLVAGLQEVLRGGG